LRGNARQGGITSKEQIMTMRHWTLGILACATAVTLALAQPAGPGPGPGAGAGCVYGGANATAGCPMGGPGMYGQGMGPGYGRGGGYGPGANLLTPDERAKYRDAMHEVKTLAECQAVVAERQQLVHQRAQEQGVTLPGTPRGDMCARMQARGLIN
jgi:hypothetical protein